ncbi:MAG: hypothetical protein V1897_10120 [Pseudomonadota bacterium]
MSIALTSDASLDFVTLQNRIKNEESKVFVRLTGLTGKTEGGVSFNAHVYESVDDNGLPFSKLFIVTGGGSADDDPTVVTWLAQNPGQKIVCENQVYVSGSLVNIAVVGKPQ